MNNLETVSIEPLGWLLGNLALHSRAVLVVVAVIAVIYLVVALTMTSVLKRRGGARRATRKSPLSNLASIIIGAAVLSLSVASIVLINSAQNTVAQRMSVAMDTLYSVDVAFSGEHRTAQAVFLSGSTGSCSYEMQSANTMEVSCESGGVPIDLAAAHRATTVDQALTPQEKQEIIDDVFEESGHSDELNGPQPEPSQGTDSQPSPDGTLSKETQERVDEFTKDMTEQERQEFIDSILATPEP